MEEPQQDSPGAETAANVAASICFLDVIIAIFIVPANPRRAGEVPRRFLPSALQKNGHTSRMQTGTKHTCAEKPGMSDSFVVSRRKAAALIAGSLVATTSGVTAAPSRSDTRAVAQSIPHRFAEGHREIATLLQRVRSTNGAAARMQAFEHCKAALQLHEVAETLEDASATATGSAALYRHSDPSNVLAKVIVRELDGWSTTDAGWLKRFADLEAVFAAHVAERDGDRRWLSEIGRVQPA